MSSVNCCATCGKKIGVLSNSWPIQDKPPLNEYRLCEMCWKAAVRINSNNTISGDIDYFTSKIDAGLMEPPVQEFMQSIIAALPTGGSYAKGLIITPGYSIDGYRITEYLEFIEFQTAMGMGYFKTLDAGMAAMTGNAAEGFQEKISESNQSAIQGLSKKAVNLGGGAIIGMTLRHSMFASNLVGITATGTAVKIDKQ